jgi:hypothetical protein
MSARKSNEGNKVAPHNDGFRCISICHVLGEDWCVLCLSRKVYWVLCGMHLVLCPSRDVVAPEWPWQRCGSAQFGVIALF